jgi:hypothetical protein
MESFAVGSQAALIHSASKGAPPRRIADSAEGIWIRIDSALAPIIGARGVNALFKRSVSLVGEHHPWLQTAYEVARNPSVFTVLGATLSQQSASSAAAVNGELLDAFFELLSNLIGRPLTERLLQPALEKLSNGDDVQEVAR